VGHALQRGVQPQREQHARVDGRTACVVAASLDGLEQRAQVLAHDVAPHQASPVVGGQQGFEVISSQFDLQPVRF
jgi:hypothetical protein